MANDDNGEITFTKLQGFAIILSVSILGIMFKVMDAEKKPDLGSALSSAVSGLVSSDRRLLKEQAILKTRQFDGSLCTEISNIKFTDRTTYGKSSQIFTIYGTVEKVDPPLPAMMYETTYTCRNDFARSTTTETSVGHFAIDKQYNAVVCDLSAHSVLRDNKVIDFESMKENFNLLCMFEPN